MNISTEQESAALIERFADALLKTKRAERSNSARAKYFGILHRLICENRELIGARDAEEALDTLRRTGPFDRDEAAFRGACRRAINCLPQTREIGKALEDLLALAAFEADLEKVARALDEQNQDAKVENSFREFLRDVRASVTRRERIKRGLDRATSRQ